MCNLKVHLHSTLIIQYAKTSEAAFASVKREKGPLL